MHKHKHEESPEKKEIPDEGEMPPKEESALVQELREENASLKDKYLRAHAEMDNLRKRCFLEMEKKEKYAISAFAKEILRVADSMERALCSVPHEGTDAVLAGFITGVELTLKELQGVLAKHKVHEVESVGRMFDPAYHQVVQTVEDSSKENGVIVSELQKGYTIDGRILREANVVVVKNNGGG